MWLPMGSHCPTYERLVIRYTGKKKKKTKMYDFSSCTSNSYKNNLSVLKKIVLTLDCISL